MASQD
jgi:hypothetical protein